jgi:hypothetical protein
MKPTAHLIELISKTLFCLEATMPCSNVAGDSDMHISGVAAWMGYKLAVGAGR